MLYKIIVAIKAQEDLKALLKSEPNSYKKAIALIKELQEHPREGRGKPTLKKYDLAGCYARKISDKHRLVYSIEEDIITVHVLSARGHYDDK